MESTEHNSEKSNIEFLLYFIYLCQGQNHLKDNKGDNIIVCNIPCSFSYPESNIPQWKANIECMPFIPPPTLLCQSIVML